MKFIFSILIIVFLLACENNTKKNSIQSGIISLKDFAESDITGDTLFEIIIRHASIEVVDSFFFINTHSNSDGIVQIYDFAGNKRRSFGEQGRGPNEILFGKNIQINRQKQLYYLYDSNLHKLIEYKYCTDDSVSASLNKIYNKFNMSALDVVLLDSTCYLASVYNEKGIFGIFSLDSSNKKEFLGKYPIGTEGIIELNSRLQVSSIVNNKHDKIYYASFDFGYIACDDLITMKNQWKIMLTEPFYKIESGKLIFHKQKHKDGFAVIKLTNQNLYTLYKGSTEINSRKNYRSNNPGANTILVFNTKGKPVKKYTLNKNIVSFCVDKQEKNLYAIEFVEGQSYVVRFKL